MSLIGSVKMNVIDIFSGCGGLSYGFEMADFNVLLGIDNDKAALKSFVANHKDSNSMLTDITQVSKLEISEAVNHRKVDVIVGGPPCQGMSLSGPRKFHDPRNSLYLSFISAVNEFKPKAFVIENVPGIVSLFGGKIKASILEEFEAMGYEVKVDMLLASDYGVPQNRKRVFFVGFRKDLNIEYSFPQPTTLFEHEKVTAEDATSDLPLLEDFNHLGEEIQDYKTPPQNHYQKIMRRKSGKVKNHIATNHSEQTRSIIALVPEGENYKSLPENLRSTRKFNVAWTRYHSKKPTPTIDTGHRHHFHYSMNRVPTVRENARFQSFPDDFVFLGNRTEQYRQVGNAVPPLLAFEIANSIKQVLS